MKYRAILVAVDAGPDGAATVDYAFALGEKAGATVHAVHASPYVAESHDPASSFREASLARARLELAAAVAKHRSSPNMGKCLVSTNEPISAILQAATSVSADLIIVSTHARRGVGRLIMGSVAASVLEEASVPVLILKSAATVEHG
jgi:nucleotide-binding universal stress UspA family protein